MELDGNALAEIWREMTVVRRVLAPTMGLLGFEFIALIFYTESKWAKLTTYIASGLYFFLYKVIAMQDAFASNERQTLLLALHFHDIDHKSGYLCRHFRKLHYRIRSFPHDFYPWGEIGIYKGLILIPLFCVIFLSYYLDTGLAAWTIGLLFLAFLVHILLNDLIHWLLIEWHPLKNERKAVFLRQNKVQWSLLRNWRHLCWRDLLHILSVMLTGGSQLGFERKLLHIEQTSLGQENVEAGLLGNRGDEQAVIYCCHSHEHTIRCLYLCGFNCTLRCCAKSEVARYWRKIESVA